MKTRFPRVDANHKAIVKVLREHPDVTVQSLAGVGDGTPDLLVGIAGLTHLVEVKDGDKSPSGRSLKPSQVEWVEHWNGTPVVVLFDVNQARDWLALVRGATADIMRHERRPAALQMDIGGL